VRALLAGHPDWTRRRIGEQLAWLWDWRNPAGQLKDMAVMLVGFSFSETAKGKKPSLIGAMHDAPSTCGFYRLYDFRELPVFGQDETFYTDYRFWFLDDSSG
jgi:hypothetical protein